MKLITVEETKNHREKVSAKIEEMVCALMDYLHEHEPNCVMNITHKTATWTENGEPYELHKILDEEQRLGVEKIIKEWELNKAKQI